MPSSTHICNLALQEIGEPTITDIDDATVPAGRCKLIYDDVVAEVSASKYWSKIKSRVELALLPDPPVYGFNFQFQLPVDHLNIIEINEFVEGDIPYQIEGDRLLINQSSVFIKYTRTQANPNLWGKFLQRAVVLRLAAGISFIFTASPKLTEDLYRLYRDYSRASAATDSNQGSRRKMRATTITRVR